MRQIEGDIKTRSMHKEEDSRVTSGVGSMPVLTASAPMSDRTASIWSDKCWVGTVWTPLTPLVFWAVRAEMAEVPKTPLA